MKKLVAKQLSLLYIYVIFIIRLAIIKLLILSQSEMLYHYRLLLKNYLYRSLLKNYLSSANSIEIYSSQEL